ncbi:hypothetical protein [Xanthomonas sp. GW]|uniref:hypothetical protein n=1 Tax=Xanthomonas sp. GW TaxID=2724121 RepID=UPI00163991E4|nr:hypothetical protein [Xanthomonas sp. GW]
MTTTFDLRNRLDEEFSGESDRGCAILTVCLLEEGLAHLLGALLPGGLKDAKQFMPKGRLSMGIINSHRLGLISDEVASNLRLLIEIRNSFAHGILDNVSFRSEHIRTKVLKLALPNLSAVPDVRDDVESDPRKRYMMAFDNMFFTLNEIKNQVSRLPRINAPTLTITRINRGTVA